MWERRSNLSNKSQLNILQVLFKSALLAVCLALLMIPGQAVFADTTEEPPAPEVEVTPAPEETSPVVDTTGGQDSGFVVETTPTPTQQEEQSTETPVTPTEAPEVLPTETPTEEPTETPTEVLTETVAAPLPLEATESDSADKTSLPLPTEQATLDTLLVPTTTDIQDVQPQAATEEGVALDPWFFVGNGDGSSIPVKHVFYFSGGSCTSSATLICHESATPLQDSLLYLLQNKITPVSDADYYDGNVYVENGNFGDLNVNGLTYGSLSSVDFNNIALTFTGGQSGGSGTTSDLGNVTLSNLQLALAFKNFVFGGNIGLTNVSNLSLQGSYNGTIILNNTSNIIIEGTSGADTINAVVTGSNPVGVDFKGRDGDDSLIIDFKDVNPQGELNYDGGVAFDTLSFKGGAFNSIEYHATDAHAGSIMLDDYLINYKNIEPITDATVTVDRVIGLSDNPDIDAVLADSGSNFSISGSTFEAVTFAKPTNSLTVQGLAGNDSITINTLTLSACSLIVEAETITVNGPVTSTTGNITLNATAENSVTGVGTLGTPVNLTAQVIINGSVTSTTGALLIQAIVNNTVNIPSDSLDEEDLVFSSISEAKAEIGAGAVVNVATLQVIAKTNTSFTYTANAVTTDAYNLGETLSTIYKDGVAKGTLTATINNKTYAGITGGARVTVGNGVISAEEPASVLINAVDHLTVSIAITDTSDPSRVNETLTVFSFDFDRVKSTLNVSRDTQAYVKNTPSGSYNTLESGGLVKIHAENNGTVSNVITSDLVGKVLNSTTKDDALAFALTAKLAVNGLDVLALTNTSYTALAKEALNDVTGATKTYISAGTVTSTDDIALTAQDTSSLSAESKDLVLKPTTYFVATKFSYARNDFSRDTQSYIEAASTINAAGYDVTLLAKNSTTIIARVHTVSIVKGGNFLPTSSFKAAALTLSVNVLLGNVKAYIIDSTVTANNLTVSAKDDTAMDATSDVSATAKNSEDVLLLNNTSMTIGGSIALNIIGGEIEDVANLALAAIDSLIGTNFANTSTTRQIYAYVQNSTVTLSGDYVISAESSPLINATVQNTASSAGDSRYGAKGSATGGVLVSNLISSETLAYINYTATQGVFTVGGNLTVSAVEHAGIYSNAKIVATTIITNDGGMDILKDEIRSNISPDFTTADGSKSILFGNKIKIAKDYLDYAYNTSLLIQPANVQPGEMVKLDSDLGGGMKGDIYKYIGASALDLSTLDLTEQNYSNTSLWAKVGGKPGAVYQYMGTDASLNLGRLDYTDLGYWKLVPETEIIPENLNVSNSNSTVLTGLVVRNEVHSKALAYINNANITVTSGNLTVTAIVESIIKASADSSAEASGGSAYGSGSVLAANVTIATNMILSKANAYITNSTITTSAGDLIITARNSSEIEATVLASVTSGENAATLMFAFNTIGWQAQNILFQAIDALIGSVLGTAEAAEVQAYLKDTITHVANVLSLLAENLAKILATVGNEATSAAVALYGASSMAVSGVLASNFVNSKSKAYIQFSSGLGVIEVDGPLTVTAKDEASITSYSRMVATSSSNNDAGASIVNGLGKSLLYDYAYTTKSGTQTIQPQTLVRVADDYNSALGARGTIYGYKGTTELTGVNLGTYNYANSGGLWQPLRPTDLVPTGLNVSDSSAKAVGFLIVRNDLRSEVESFVDHSDVDVAGDISMLADEAAILQAALESVASASGGSLYGSGTVFGLNATVATNLVLSKANAYITNSNVTTTAGGDLSLEAYNESLIDATALSSTMSGDTAVGITLAFNTIGWEAQNILFQAVDALITTDIGNEKPAEAQAYITDTPLTIAGDLTLSAVSNVKLNATMSNAASSEAVALYDANGKSASFLFASNMVSSLARAYIKFTSTHGNVTVGGALTMHAEDNTGIYANVKVVTSSITTNDGGAKILNNSIINVVDVFSVDHVSGETSVLLDFGDRVRLADDYANGGTHGGIYEYMGADLTTPQNLSTTDYTDLGYWKLVPETQLVPQGYNLTPSNSNAVGALVVRNDLRSEVKTYLDYVTLQAGSITMNALENAHVEATADTTSESSGGSVFGEGDSLAFAGTVATNLILSSADAYINNCSVVTTSGGLSITSQNTSVIDATNLTMAKSGGNALGLILAFNTVGWKAQNILFNTIDALLGDPLIANAFGNEQPARVEAYILNSFLNIAGALSLSATSTAVINSSVSNTATSAPTAFIGAGGMSISGVLSSNMVSSKARAYIDHCEYTYTTSDDVSTLRTGDRIRIVSGSTTGTVGETYEYTGADKTYYSYTSTWGNTFLKEGDLVKVLSGYANGGTANTVYRYAPTDSNYYYMTLNLANQNYTNTSWWQPATVYTHNSPLAEETYTNTSLWREIFYPERNNTVYADGNINISAKDDAQINAETKMYAEVSPSNDMGLGIVNNYINMVKNFYLFTSKSGLQEIGFGAQVRVADDYNELLGTPGGLYKYMGTSTSLNLGIQDYTNFELWKLISETNIISDSAIYTGVEELGLALNKEGLNGSATSIYALVDRNDLRSEVFAFINDSSVIAGGNICLTADESALMNVLDDSVVSTWSGGGGIIATNIVLSKANTYITNSRIVTNGAGSLNMVGKNTSIVNATASSVVSGWDKTVSIIAAFNSMGWKAQNILFSAIDALIGDPLLADEAFGGEQPIETQAYIKNSMLQLAGGLGLSADNTAKLTAVAGNESSSVAELDLVFSAKYATEMAMSAGGLLTSNKVSSFAKAYVDYDTTYQIPYDHITTDSTPTLYTGDWVKNNSTGNIYRYLGDEKTPVWGSENFSNATLWAAVTHRVDIGGNILITAQDAATIDAHSTVVQLAVNSNTIDGLADIAESLNLTDYQYTTASGSQYVLPGDRVRLGASYAKGGEAGSLYVYLGSVGLIDLGNVNYASTNPLLWALIPSGAASVADYFPNIGNLTDSSANAFGGLVVLNDLKGTTEAYINNATVLADGDVLVSVTENALMLAYAEITVTASGGSTFGPGKVLAINGQIVTNVVLSSAKAYISNSDLEVGGNLQINAKNSTRMDATVLSATGSGAKAIGVTLAFNSIGWLAQNVLFNTIDALIGSPEVAKAFGNESPAEALAYLLDTIVNVIGNLGISAISAILMNATISNAASTVASGMFDNDGASFGGLLASNMVSSKALAYIKFTGARGTVDVGGDLTVFAEDISGIFSNTKMVSSTMTTNDGGVSIIDETVKDRVYADYSSSDGSKLITFGKRVRLDDAYENGGNPGSVYTYMGTQNTLDLSTEDYTDLGYWKEVLEAQLVPTGLNFSDSNANAVGGLVVRNETKSIVQAYIQNVTVVAEGHVSITALDRAVVRALVDSATISSGGSSFDGGDSLAVNGTIATNLVLSEASAYIVDSSITTHNSGDVTLIARNTSQVNAILNAMANSQGNSVGVMLAFNTVGWDAQNVLFNTVDALIGSSEIANAFQKSHPALTEAYIHNSTVNAAGNVTLAANSQVYQFDMSSAITTGELDDVAEAVDQDDLDTHTVDEIEEDAAADALILADLLTEFEDNFITIRGDLSVTTLTAGSRWLISDSLGYSYIAKLENGNLKVYETSLINAQATNDATSDVYMIQNASGVSVGGLLVSNLINTITRTYIDFDNTTPFDQHTIQTGGNLSMSASSDTMVNADNNLIVMQRSTSDGGLSMALDIANKCLNEYQFTTKSGIQSVMPDMMVRVDDEYAVDTSAKGKIYLYLGSTTANLNLGTISYSTSADWMEMIDLTSLTGYLPFPINISESSSTAVGGMVVRNEVQSETETKIDNAKVVVGGNVDLAAYDNAFMRAYDKSTVTSSGGGFDGKGTSTAVGFVISTNAVLSKANAYIEDSTVNASGSLSINAHNRSTLNAILENNATSNGVSVGITLAFNTIGWKSQNILFNTVDALVGSVLGTQQPAEAQAYITNSTLTIGNGISVKSDSKASLDAYIQTVVTSVRVSTGNSTSVSVGAVIALNLVSTLTKAYITAPDGYSSTITLSSGSADISANDQASIKANVGVASLAVSCGDKSVAVTVGMSISRNQVNTDTEAFIKNTQFTVSSGNISLTATEQSSIDAVGSASSISLAAGASSGTAFAGGGAIVTNHIQGATKAYAENSTLTANGTGNVSLTASNSANIDATVVSCSVAVAISGGGTSPGVSIGVSIARNFIGWSEYGAPTPLQVLAYLKNSDVFANGLLGLSANSTSTIDALIAAISVGAAASAESGVGVSLAGLYVENKISMQVQAYIDGIKSLGVRSGSGDMTLLASDTSTILAKAFSASLAASFAGNNAVAVSVGLSVARNYIQNVVDAFINNASQVKALAGMIKLEALTQSVINTIATAASLAVSLSGSNSVAVSGGGALAMNAIKNGTHAYIKNSTLTDISGAVQIKASDKSSISALVVGVSGSLAIGGSNGVAVSIGISFAQNLIGYPLEFKFMTSSGVQSMVNGDTVKLDDNYTAGGDAGAVYRYIGSSATRDLASQNYSNTALWTKVTDLAVATPSEVQAYVMDSSITAAGGLSLIATAIPVITSTVLAGSVAVAGGGTSGTGVSVAGAYSENKIATLVQAFIDGDGVKQIRAGSVSLTASDGSAIRTNVAAASVAGGFGGTAGVAVSMGLAIARNLVANEVEAYIINAGSVQSTSGNITLTAESLKANFTPTYTTSSGSQIIRPGDTVLVNVGYNPLQGSIGETYRFVEPGYTYTTLETPSTLKNGTSVKISDNMTGYTIGDIYQYTGTDLSSSVDLSAVNYNSANWAKIYPVTVNLGTENYYDTSRWEKETTIKARSAAASLALAGSGTASVGVSGAGAYAENIILTHTNAYIQDSTVESNADIVLSAQNTATISSIVASASASVAISGTVGVGASIGAALAFNYIGWTLDGTYLPAEVQAYIQNSVVTAGGTLSLTSTANETIESTILSGSAAIAGGQVGVAVSGAGVFAFNKIATLVQSFIDGDGVSGGITAGIIQLGAQDTSKITSIAGAASIAASFGLYTGVAVSVGVALAHNEIGNIVQAYILDANDLVKSTIGNIELTVIENATIKAIAAAASIAVSGGLVGVGVSGAGAEATNIILSKANAFVENSVLDSVGDVRITSTSTSTITSSIVTASAGVGVGAVGVGASIGVSIARNLIGWSLNTGMASTYTTGDEPATILTNQTVKILSGVRAGDVYKYIGAQALNNPDLNDDENYLLREDFSDSTRWEQVNLTKTYSEVQAYIKNSSVTADGQLVVNATANQSINAEVISGSVAMSGGAVGVSLSGAGVGAENRIAVKVMAYIDGDGTTGIRAASIQVIAQDTSTIKAETGAASIAFSVGGVGVSVSIGISLAFNEISSLVQAFITNADNFVETTGGNILVQAIEDATIEAISAAASAAVGFGGAVSISGAGAAAVNVILTWVKAFISESIIRCFGDITVQATNSATIIATILAFSAGVGVGAFGVAGSMGASIAYNFIGWTMTGVESPAYVQAYILNSSVTARGILSLIATATQTITATVLSGSVAVTAGSVGVGLSGAGSSAVNKIKVVVAAFIDGDGALGISADSISLSATDTSIIKAIAGSASLAASFGIGGVSVSVGVGLANNEISSEVLAYIKDADTHVNTTIPVTYTTDNEPAQVQTNQTVLVKTGTYAGNIYKYIGAEPLLDSNTYVITHYLRDQDYSNTSLWQQVNAAHDISLTATNNATIQATSKAASAAVGAGFLGVGVSGAGADAQNVILTKTHAYVSGSILLSGHDITIQATDTSNITASVLALSDALGGGAIGVGVAIGSSTAQNYIGYNLSGTYIPAEVYAYVSSSSLNAVRDISVHAIANETITASVSSDSVALAVGYYGGAAAGAGVSVTSKIATKVFSYIQSSTGTGIDAVRNISILAQDTSTITATASAASIAGAVGAFAGSVSVGVSLASNLINNQVKAYVNSVTLDALGYLDIQALESATITATSQAAALAVSIGVGLSMSGGGASASATITNTVQAYANNSTITLSGDLNVLARDVSTTNVQVTATSASLGLIAIAVSGSVTTSTITPTVLAEVLNSNVTADDITITASAQPKSYASARGFSVSSGASVGVSKATITTTPTVTTAIGGTSKTINAGSLTVSASQKLPDTGKTATAFAVGSAGGLLLGVDATVTSVTFTGNVSSYIAGSTTLNITGATEVSARSLDTQLANSSSCAYGLIAVGATKATSGSNNTVNVYLGNSVILTGGSLSVSATGDDDNYAETTAGAGGVVGVAAASPSTTSVSNTQATLGTGNQITLTGSGTGVFNLSASHVATSGTKVNTTSYGALSGAGADADNTVLSTVLAKINNNSTIYAKKVSVTATNTVNSSDDIYGSTGGIASGAGSDSTTTISFTTTVEIGTNVRLETVGIVSNSLDYILAALNIVNASDKVVFETGGAISGAGAYSTISVMTDLARVLIGNGSNLISVSAMDISARGRGTLVTTVAADTYGLGTVTIGNAKIEIHPTNQVTIGSAFVKAYGDLNISAGRSTVADMVTAADAYTVTAHWDGFAGSAIPISDIDAEAYLIQTNTITINSGAQLKCARQVNLYAQRLSTEDVLGKAKAVSWVSAVGDALNNLLGGGGEEQYAGHSLQEAHGTVIMNGSIETGLTRNQTLTITGWTIDEANETGTITATASDGITWTVSIKALESALLQSLRNAESMLTTYGATNATLKSFYENEVARLKAELEAAGLSENVSRYNSKTGQWEYSVVYPSVHVLTITINPIWAQAGVIDIRTDQLQGTGTFTAPQ